MTMKIENYEYDFDNTTDQDQYNFQHNPTVFDDEISSNFVVKTFPYKSHSHVTSGGAIAPKQLVLTGHFDGANKNTNYQNFAKHVIQNNILKKLYFKSDRFYLCLGRQTKQTNTGGRTLFVDYVATFQTVVGTVMGDTLKTGSSTNDGNIPCYVEEITGEIDDGAVNITITDTLGNQITIDNSQLTTGKEISIRFIKINTTGGGLSVTDYNYCLHDTAGSPTRIYATTTGGDGLIKLDVGDAGTDLVITNLSSTTVSFRDGWSA